MSELGEDRVPEETRTEIMEATFRAVSEHGYADLRMRDIGEEMEKTRQIIHYHYDGKYDLLANFLEYIIEQYEGSVEVDRDVPPREELDLRVRQCLFGPGFEEFDHWERMKVYHELFTHAIHAARERKLSLGHDGAPEQALQAIDEFVIDSLIVEE
jgi:AcrR family transcriptional regulator